MKLQLPIEGSHFQVISSHQIFLINYLSTHQPLIWKILFTFLNYFETFPYLQFNLQRILLHGSLNSALGIKFNILEK